MKRPWLLLSAPLLALGAGVFAQVSSKEEDQAREKASDRAEPSQALIAARDPASAVRFEAQRGDFIAARTALGRISDRNERAELREVLDELELSALCDQAEKLINKREGAQAYNLLSTAMLRLESATTAMPRAIALQHLADALARGDPPSSDFLTGLAKAKENADELEAKRQAAIKATIERIEANFTNAEEFTEAAKNGVVGSQTTVVKSNAEKARQAFDAAEKDVAKLKSLLDRKEWEMKRVAYVARMTEMQDSLSLSLGTLHYDNESFNAAEQEVKAGLLRSPDDADLLELLVKIKDQWRYHRQD